MNDLKPEMVSNLAAELYEANAANKIMSEKEVE